MQNPLRKTNAFVGLAVRVLHSALEERVLDHHSISTQYIHHSRANIGGTIQEYSCQWTSQVHHKGTTSYLIIVLHQLLFVSHTHIDYREIKQQGSSQ